MACCPAHDDRTPSLGVTLGRKAILFHCFAGCDQQSVLSALAREGFEVTRFFSGSSAENQFKSTRVGKPSAAALRIWREAEPLGASPAKAYLESRGILAASSALRFHPQTPLGPKGRTRFLPAMIAAVSLDEGPIAIHRILSTGLQPRPPSTSQSALGSLDKLLSVSLLQFQQTIAEGIEAMSAYAHRCPVWATLRNERFSLVSVRDRDRASTSSSITMLAASWPLLVPGRAFARDGRTIHVRKPSSRVPIGTMNLQHGCAARRHSKRREGFSNS
ncbi:MAG: virulence protein [Blastomonas sp.]